MKIDAFYIVLSFNFLGNCVHWQRCPGMETNCRCMAGEPESSGNPCKFHTTVAFKSFTCYNFQFCFNISNFMYKTAAFQNILL